MIRRSGIVERALAPALVLLVSAGCREAPPQAPEPTSPAATKAATAEPSTAERVDTAEPSTAESSTRGAPTPGQPPRTVNGTAAPVDPAGIEAAAARKAQLHAMRASVRQGHFEAQRPVPLPTDAPAEIGRLVPPTAKLVEFEINRRMKGLAPAPGRRIVLRWLTRLEGELASALVRRAVGQWLGRMPPEGAQAVEHPRWGTLRWTVHTPDERATRAELVLESPTDDRTLALPDLDGAPWRAALDGAQTVGFEHGRYHAQRGGDTYTDLERLSAIVETDDGPGLQRRMTQACLAAGYTVDDDDARLLRAPGKARTTFTTRLGEGRLTLHHQRRWRRGAAPAGEPAKAP